MSSKPTYEELEARVAALASQLTNKTHTREGLYARLFDQILYEVHIWDLVYDENKHIKTWRLRDANPAALSNWGYSLIDVIGKTTDEIFTGTNATAQFMPVVQKIFRDKQAYQWEGYFAATGQTLSMLSIPLDGAFISIGVDVTESKNIQRNLQESIWRLDECISAGKIGLWDWDLTTNQVRYSKEYKKQIGYEEHEIRDDFDEWETRVHPDDLEKVKQITQHSIDTLAKEHETEFRYKHKDGSYRWILAHASVIADEQGRPVRMLGSHIDISERKLLENYVNQTQKMEALGTLTSGVAHDFNNLLAPILGYTELAQKHLVTDAPVTHYLTKVHDAASTAKELVQKLLLMSKPANDEKHILHLVEKVDEVCSVISASAPDNIVIDKQIAWADACIKGDAADVFQILLNICNNAVQAMPNGGRLSLSVSKPDRLPRLFEAKHDAYLLIEITDTGHGIAKDIIGKIYDPFFTTKHKSGARGTGLGLAIVASLIEKYSGFIDVKSTVGKGTTFFVYLPATECEVVQESKQKRGNVSVSEGKILLLDDEEMICELASEVLVDLGYTVAAFCCPHDALAALQSEPDQYQLVITDYSMPEMSGPAFIRSVKQINSQIPIVLLTGYAESFDAQTQQKIGYDRAIAKPFRMSTMKSVVAELCQSA